MHRAGSCFNCWHSRRIDGLNGVCVCVANVSKTNKPDLIEEPNSGECKQFFSKDEVEKDVITYLHNNRLEMDKYGNRRKTTGGSKAKPGQVPGGRDDT